MKIEKEIEVYKELEKKDRERFFRAVKIKGVEKDILKDLYRKIKNHRIKVDEGSVLSFMFFSDIDRGRIILTNSRGESVSSCPLYIPLIGGCYSLMVERLMLDGQKIIDKLLKNVAISLNKYYDNNITVKDSPVYAYYIKINKHDNMYKEEIEGNERTISQIDGRMSESKNDKERVEKLKEYMKYYEKTNEEIRNMKIERDKFLEKYPNLKRNDVVFDKTKIN